MDHIATLLPAVLHKRGLGAHATAALVVHRAAQWLAEQLPVYREEVCVKSFRDGTLVIECTHSIAAQECQQLHGELLVHIRDACGHQGVETIRIVRVA